MPARLLTACLLLLLLGLSARAQPLTGERPGQDFPSPDVYTLPDFWLNIDSTSHYLEWRDGTHELYAWNYLSWLSGALVPRAPLVIYRQAGLNLLAGTQESYALDPLMDWVPFSGLRGDLDALGLRWTAAYGTTTTDNLPILLQNQPLGRFEMVGAGVSAPLGAHGLARLSRSSWAPANLTAGLDRHVLYSFELDPRFNGPFDLNAGVGLDTGDMATPIAPVDRQAFDWAAQYHNDWLSISGQQQKNGRAYGPNIIQNYRRGQNILFLDGQFQLADNFSLAENYQQINFQTPVGQPLQSVNNVNWQHQFNWSPTDALRMTGQYQTTTASSLGLVATPQVRQQLYRLDTSYQLSPEWQLGGRLLRRQLLGQTSGQVGLQVVHLPDPAHRLSLSYDKLTGSAAGFGDQLAASYQYLPDEDTAFGLDFSRLNQLLLDPALTRTQTTTLGLSFFHRPTARWTFSGNCALSQGLIVGGQLQYQARAAYLLDDHEELALTYARNPFLVDSLGVQTAVNPGNSLFLELRQSFGGPLENEFHSRLQPRVTVSVQAHAPGSEERVPVSGALITLGAQELRSGPGGLARFSGLEAGQYPLRLDLNRVGPNYEFDSPGTDQELTLEPGDRRDLTFVTTAWSSVYAVVFNDVDALGELAVGYIPFTNVPLDLDGPGGKMRIRTDEDGVSRFPRLKPGDYVVTVDRAALPPSTASTTPTHFTFHLNPGQEQVLSIGLEAFGRLDGKLQLLGPNGLTPASGVELRTGGRILGTTETDGSFSLRLPAGRLRLDASRARLGPDYYFLAPSDWEFNLEPNQSLNRDLVLARYARAEIQLTADGKKLPLSGVTIELPGRQFLYTDEEGQATFDELPAGDYEFVISGLPTSFKLVGSDRVPMHLGSGQVRKLIFPVRRAR